MNLLGAKLSNRYEIVREIGRGGMGIVCLARDPLLDREVAVKLVPPNLLSAEAEERFRREARIVARMDHPAIVTVYDVGHFDGSLFYVMPVMTGTSLRELLREGSLRLGEVVDIGIQIADALDYSHGLGVVHRDLRPENVTVTRGEGDGIRIRIMDFGLAHPSVESQLTRMTEAGPLTGAATYFSPEQVEGNEVDARSDVYALGAVLFECLTGGPLFTGDTQSVLYRVVHEVAPPLGAEVDAALRDVILRCLAKDPARRSQSAREVVEALERYRSRLRAGERGRLVSAGGARGARVAMRDLVPFVGRERELGELQRFLNAAAAGEGHFATVSGEPGIGKTRLLHELECLARARNVRVLHGRFIAEDRGFPYQGFCEAIQEYFRSREAADEVADLSDLAGDLVRIFPVLSEIAELGGEAPELPSDDARRIEDRTAVFDLLARAFVRLAAGRPLVLLFEDLHGADVSVEALQYVVRRLGVAPVLVVGTYRPGEVARHHTLTRVLESFRGDRHFTAIQLGPLGAAEHRALIEALVDGERVSDALAETLFGATEGNPFFAIELARSLVDSGGIAGDETGMLILASELGITSDALPETIQQVVERQIERLPEELREMLSVASVLGRTFEYRDLEPLLEGREWRGDPEEAVERLLRSGLLEEREWRGDRLAFASRVVRDVLYARLPRRRRRALHRRVAAHLEERYAGRRERVYTQLLHHYSHADVPEKAIEYGFQAALKALDAFSPEDAVSSIRTALEFLEDEELASDPVQEGEARLVLAGAYRIQGNLTDALREAERGAAIFEREGQASQELRAAVMAAEIAWDGRKVDETRQWVDQGIERARALGDAWSLTRLLTLGATVANLRGEYDAAKELLEEAEHHRPRSPERRRVPRGGRLVVGLNNPLPIAAEPAALKTGDDEEVLGNVFERLVRTGPRGILSPALADRWEMLAGGSAFLITLRSGVRFSDGSALVAADVKSSFERAIRTSVGALPAAYAPIQGVVRYRNGFAPHVEGIGVRSDRQVEIRLTDPLPLYPALLTDVSASIVRETAAGVLLGTGPFRVVSRTPDRIVLERNPERVGRLAPSVNEVEFRLHLDAAETAAGFRSGELDVARGLASDETERVLREPRLRATLVDVSSKDSCFLVFNSASPTARHHQLRRALAGLIRVQAIVWQTLGRTAVPATGLIPPGMLGHDPGRRLPSLDRERAAELLREAGVDGELQLAAVVSPKFVERHDAFVARIFEAWAELGVRAAVATPTVESFFAAMDDPRDADLMIVRWSADYDDPDNLTYRIFHSREGRFRRWWSSPELDDILEAARAETRPGAREALYRRFEATLVESGAVVPLFHGVDSRIVGRAVRGLELSNSAPFVNYADLGREPTERRPAAPQETGGGIVRVALSSGHVRSLDPALVVNTEMGEVVPNVFETLTRVIEGARVVPWLASEFHAEDEGRRFRFRLRENVRFHDGRRLTARDVRYSFERLLQQRRASTARNALLPIRGARALVDGEAGDLEGFRILSASEFSLELDAPLPFFAVLLTDPCTAIVPEGQHRFDASWREQCAGTGPFRVAAFEPGTRLELERNPTYWREGFPRAEGLVFTFGLAPDQVLSEFRAGRLSLASGLASEDVDVLRHDPEFAPRYYEAPSLSLAYLALNTRRGPLADVEVRRRVAHAIDVSTVLRRALGRFARPARGIILPGLVGYTAPEGEEVRSPVERVEPEIELTAAIGSGFARTLGRLADELVEAFRQNGVRIRLLRTSPSELDEARESGSVDMVWTVWVADFPDTDGIVGAILHTSDGAYGRFCGSAEVDRLIERGRAETDVAARDAIYREIETVVARDALMVPLVHPHNYRFARPEVEGVVCSSLSYPVVAYENLRIR